MSKNIENCGWEVRWLFLAVGIPIALIGGFFTASVIGAVVGIPFYCLPGPCSATLSSNASVLPESSIRTHSWIEPDRTSPRR